MMHKKRMCFTPLSFSIWIAATLDPPVASMGSTTNTSRSSQSAGSLQKYSTGSKRIRVTVQTDMAHLRRRDHVQDPVYHADTRPENGNHRQLLAA